MASRSFRIFGSGTFSTWTVLRPDQTFARMSDPRLLELGLVERLRGTLLQLALCPLALGGALGARDLAGLDDLLETAQVVLRLRERVLAGHLAHDLAELAAARGIVDLEVDLGAAVAWRVLERDPAGAVVAVVLGPPALNVLASEEHSYRCLRRAHPEVSLDSRISLRLPERARRKRRKSGRTARRRQSSNSVPAPRSRAAASTSAAATPSCTATPTDL